MRRFPKRLFGDKIYDIDPLNARLKRWRENELIAPHRSVHNRRNEPTQDGLPLRRFRRSWKVERLLAWRHAFRRIVTRWECRLNLHWAFVLLSCSPLLA